MSTGFQQIKLSDPDHNDIELMVTIPKGDDPWGVLAPIKDTVWGQQIRALPGEELSVARHGYMTPLLKHIGPPPYVLSKRIPDKDGYCVLSYNGACSGASVHCRPGPKLPTCYEPPNDPTGVLLDIALAWRDGIYVVIVDGKEFSI